VLFTSPLFYLESRENALNWRRSMPLCQPVANTLGYFLCISQKNQNNVIRVLQRHRQTDRPTDGRTDGIAISISRVHIARARINECEQAIKIRHWY